MTGLDWRPEAQRDPYGWLAVFGGHLSIGVALWLAFAWLGPWQAVAAASAIYALWEARGAYRHGLLLWDSLLDWCGVTFGALTAAALWQQLGPLAAGCCAAALVIGASGAIKRQGN